MHDVASALDYASVSSTFGLTNSATLSAWINLASLSESGAFVKIGQGVDNSIRDGFGFGVGENDMDNAGNNLLILAEGRAWVNTGVTLGFGTWTHVAMTVTPGTGNATYFQAWINGVAAGSPGSITNVLPAMQRTGLGGYDEKRVANLMLDDVQIYDQPLSSAQIAFLASHPGTAVPEASSFMYLGMLGIFLAGYKRFFSIRRR